MLLSPHRVSAYRLLSLESQVLMFRVPSDVETTLMEDVMGASAFIRSLGASSHTLHVGEQMRPSHPS